MINILLLIFGALGFAGAGAAFAVGRMREQQDGVRDTGMWMLTTVLVVFSAICTMAVVGVLGIGAVGGPFGWASYVFCAQRIGFFSIEPHRPRAGVRHRTTS